MGRKYKINYELIVDFALLIKTFGAKMVCSPWVR